MGNLKEPPSEILNEAKKLLGNYEKAKQVEKNAKTIKEAAKKKLDAIAKEFNILNIQDYSNTAVLVEQSKTSKVIDTKQFYEYCESIKKTDVFWNSINIVKDKVKDYIPETILDRFTTKHVTTSLGIKSLSTKKSKKKN